MPTGKYLLIFFSGFLLSLFSVNVLKKISMKHELLIPKGTPLVGGIGMGLPFILVSLGSSILAGFFSKELAGISICLAGMLAFGVIDDWRELSIRSKFLSQIFIAGLLIFLGVQTRIVYIGPVFNIVITLLWLLGITNAFNHLDVTDGLAAGVAVIVSSAFFVISLLNGDARMAIVNCALIGAVSGFLVFNLPPAKVYMGNSGSHFLGFTLAAIALAISYAPIERKIALLSPVVILGLPIFDTLLLILMRLNKKRVPFKKSDDHIALRLLQSGYSKQKTLFSLLLGCAFFSACGVSLSQISSNRGIAICALLILTSLIMAFRVNRLSVND